jgi:hypothetical protein
VPFGFDAFGVRVGLPDEIDFSRESRFAVSDYVAP